MSINAENIISDIDRSFTYEQFKANFQFGDSKLDQNLFTEEPFVQLYKEYQTAGSFFSAANPNYAGDWDFEMRSIIETGQLGNGSVLPHYPGRIGITHNNLFENRAALLKIYFHNPQLAKAIVEHNIVGGHGSSSGSFLGVLEHGLIPQGELIELGSAVSTGEIVKGGLAWNKDRTSLAWWSDVQTLKSYAVHRPVTDEALIQAIKELQNQINTGKGIGFASVDSLRQQMLFFQRTLEFLSSNPDSVEASLIRKGTPIIYFVSGDNFDSEDIVPGNSSIPSEYGVKSGIPLKNIRIILVPFTEVDVTQEILKAQHPDIQVFSIESYNNNLPSRSLRRDQSIAPISIPKPPNLQEISNSDDDVW
jgi:hypothetical protein